MQVLKTQLDAKAKGFADVVYLDAKTDTYLEEVSSCNIFVVKGKTIRTPPLQVMATYKFQALCHLLHMQLSCAHMECISLLKGQAGAGHNPTRSDKEVSDRACQAAGVLC